jgi:hypothetical protein
MKIEYNYETKKSSLDVAPRRVLNLENLAACTLYRLTPKED